MNTNGHELGEPGLTTFEVSATGAGWLDSPAHAQMLLAALALFQRTT
jgi:hypothetical protein